MKNLKVSFIVCLLLTFVMSFAQRSHSGGSFGSHSSFGSSSHSSFSSPRSNSSSFSRSGSYGGNHISSTTIRPSYSGSYGSSSRSYRSAPTVVIPHVSTTYSSRYGAYRMGYIPNHSIHYSVNMYGGRRVYVYPGGAYSYSAWGPVVGYYDNSSAVVSGGMPPVVVSGNNVPYVYTNRPVATYNVGFALMFLLAGLAIVGAIIFFRR